MKRPLIDLDLPLHIRTREGSRLYRLLRFPLRRVCDTEKVRKSRLMYGARTHEEGEHEGWVLTPLGLINSTPLGVIATIKYRSEP